MLVSPATVHIVARDINVISTSCILVITLRWRTSHGLKLDSGSEVGIPNFDIIMTMGSGKGVKFLATFFELRKVALWSVLLGWTGIILEIGKGKEVGIWLGMLEEGKVVRLVDRWN